MVFLDTSAIYALADKSDANHGAAVERFEALLGAGEEIVTHNYVLLESVALIQQRLGLSAALTFSREARAFDIEWVTNKLHDEALGELERRRGRAISLVDQVSFLVMRSLGAKIAFAFDQDFVTDGFTLYEG